MSPRPKFDEVVEAVEHLPPEQQADLLDLMQRRLAEQGRHRVAQDVSEGKAEFNSGHAKRGTVNDIMDEIES